MGPEEAKRFIVEHIKVTRQRVTIAKGYLLEKFDPDTLKLIDQFVRSVDSKLPEKIVLHNSIDPIPTLNAAAEAISWRLSACEAVWGLISTGALFPASS